MKKVTYQKGSIYVTGVDTKHIEIYRFKETVELESEAEVGKHWKDDKEVDLRQYCVRVPVNEAKKILAQLKHNEKVQVRTVSTRPTNNK